jgi:CRP/FNR family transcriptional regulator, nitrogen fixation regulation protein
MLAQPLAIERTDTASAQPDASSDIKLIGITKSFARDQEIYGEGDRADLVYRVVSGAVRSYRVLADGRRQISGFYLPGDVFGVELDAERRSAAEALSDAVLVVARRSTVVDDPDQGPRLWRQALGELQRTQSHMMTLGRRTAMERVACFLLELAERLRAGIELELAMSRQDIADYLGLTIETVSRTLTQLQAEGLIKLAGCRQVRLARLAALIELCE